ncbi:GntR family transcriptional regulator [Streptomyces sp. NPDC050287]|uniref:GntR family transcriptional regulator n=1 Tax=Streptomyces sp. NPDC050287 TaxID=3365608 RepID=UPI00378F8BFC
MDPAGGKPGRDEQRRRVPPAEVYGELRSRLMMGEFPLHTRLVEDRIAAELGVSRTPVREAMRRLLSDGLVRRMDGAYYAAIPDLAGLRDLYELRTTLELRGVARALESPAVTHDPALLEPLRDEWREMWHDRPEPSADFVVMDEDFHITLLRSAGNDMLTQTLESVNARIRPVRMYDYLTEERIELTISQHLDVVEAVLAGRLEDAALNLSGHVGESLDVVEERAAYALTQMTLNRGGIR